MPAEITRNPISKLRGQNWVVEFGKRAI